MRLKRSGSSEGTPEPQSRRGWRSRVTRRWSQETKNSTQEPDRLDGDLALVSLSGSLGTSVLAYGRLLRLSYQVKPVGVALLALIAARPFRFDVIVVDQRDQGVVHVLRFRGIDV